MEVKKSDEASEARSAADQPYEYNTLMSALQVSVSKHLLDENFTLVWANDFYYQVIRYPKEEYEPRFRNNPQVYYAEHGYRDELDKITTAVITAKRKGESGYNVVTRMPVKGGGHLWVRMTGIFTNEWIDGKQVSYTVITDIDDLVQTKKNQMIMYNGIPGFVAKFKVKGDMDFELLEANDQFSKFFGNRRSADRSNDIFRRNLEINRNVIHGQFQNILNSKPVRFLIRMENAQGQTMWAQVRGECVDRIDRCPVYLLIYIDVTDLTDLRHMQEKLQKQSEQLKLALQSEESANRAKSDFLSCMSHDIRTPMNTIVGMTEIAADHLDSPEKVRDCLKKIKLSCQHLLGLINDILDMSKIESGKMTLRNDAILLPEVLENVIAIVQPMIKSREQNFAIRLHNVTHEKFLCDSLRLRQVFINILSNASKFTPQGGDVSLDVEEAPSSDPAVAQLSFRISDTGIGIKPEFLDRVFEAFSREQDGRVDKTEGSGLGLAITRKIVELIGGTISVESEWKKGTTFIVNLPLPIEKEPADIYDLRDVNVLIVDDDVATCKSTAQTLASCGAKSDWTDDFSQALSFAEQSKNSVAYDLIVVDWQMPGHDGVETVREIRKIIGGNVPILIMSAYDWSEIEETALSAGADGFLPKPLFRSTLCRTLSRFHAKNEDAPTEAEHAFDFGGKRILIADDNELNREIAVELLLKTRALVETVSNGAECVKTFLDAAPRTFDLILMDIQMPEMNGYEATRAIRLSGKSDAKTIPILAMTADAFSEDIAAAKDAGMNDHIAKPMDLSEVKLKISRAFQNR